ncbi:MAG: hypothetical protein J6Z49_07220 [Kiritimatiellae bacterium]|nr:hypothetical protein [Kiritimatiellia bacterium]
MKKLVLSILAATLAGSLLAETDGALWAVAKTAQHPQPTPDIRGFGATLFNSEVGNFSGLELGIGHTRVKGNLCGAEFNVVMACTDGDCYGFQSACACKISGELHGTQMGAVNTVKSLAAGLQFGYVNDADVMGGKGKGAVQAGLVNYADTMASGGLQIGIFNQVDQFKGGLQIGFVNLLPDTDIPFCVIVNGCF